MLGFPCHPNVSRSIFVIGWRMSYFFLVILSRVVAPTICPSRQRAQPTPWPLVVKLRIDLFILTCSLIVYFLIQSQETVLVPVIVYNAFSTNLQAYPTIPLT